MIIVRLLVAALCTIASPALFAAEGALAAPAAVPDKDAFLLAIIPDLRATLAKAEHIAGLFSPVPLPPGTLVESVGTALGDPGLANLGKGPMMVVVGPGTPTPTIALLLPGNDAMRYVDLAAQKGFLMGSVVKDVAVVSQTPDGQALGERVAAATGLPPVAAGTDVRLLIAPDRLNKAYGAFVTGMVQMATMRIPQQPGQLPVAKLATLEVAGLMELIGALDGSQIDITLDGDTVVVADLLSATPGSTLAKAMVAPAPGPNRADTHFSAMPAMVQISGKANLSAHNGYLVSLLEALRARPEGAELITQGFIDILKSLTGAWSGDLAMRIRSTDAAPMIMESVWGTGDAVKAQQAYEQALGIFVGDGALAKMYQNMGMTMVMSKNVRTTGGLPVMAQSWKIDEAKLTNKMSATFLKETQFAFGADYTASSQDPQMLDSLVAGNGTGLVLKAQTSIGPGRDLYADLDLVTLILSQMQAIAPKAAGVKKPPPGEPVTAAITWGDGRSRIEVRVPLVPFVGMATAMQQLRPERAPRPPASQPVPAGGNTF